MTSKIFANRFSTVKISTLIGTKYEVGIDWGDIQCNKAISIFLFSDLKNIYCTFFHRGLKSLFPNDHNPLYRSKV